MSNPFASLVRPTQSDQIVFELIARYVEIEKYLVLLKGQDPKSVYPNMGAPFPKENFPCLYNGFGGARFDYTQGEKVRRNQISIVTRFLTGPTTPSYRVQAEDIAYQLVNAFVNELDWRPFLQSPSTGEKFPYCDTNQPTQVQTAGRIQPFSYGEQGTYYGFEVITLTGTIVSMGRLP